MSSYWETMNCTHLDKSNKLLHPSPPMWINRDSMNWVDGSLSSHSPMSSDSISPLRSPAEDANMMECSSNELLPAPAPIRKIRNVRKSDKHHCSVCGDRPTGYHYDVLSCNGCKTFFRRTIINRRNFTCSKGGNCQFTKDFRCACRACRFDKCVRVGMNPTAIQFPNNKQHNEMDEMDSPDEDSAGVPPDDKSLALIPFVASPIRENTVNTYRFVDDIFRREDAVLRHRLPGTLPVEDDFCLGQLLKHSILIGGDKTIDRKPGVLYTTDPVRYWMVVDLLLIVEFAKTFEKFQILSELDQKCLISHIGGVLHVATQSFYSYFEAKSCTLTFPDGINAFERKMADMKKDEKRPFSRVFTNYYAEMYNAPVNEFLKNKITMKEYAFFKSISLFSPDNLEMSETGRAIANEERHRLTGLLRKYLVAEYGFKIGMSRFSCILMAISTFVNYGEKRRDYISLMNVLEFDIANIGKDIYLRRPIDMV